LRLGTAIRVIIQTRQVAHATEVTWVFAEEPTVGVLGLVEVTVLVERIALLK
jgi:hypothetical protein